MDKLTKFCTKTMHNRAYVEFNILKIIITQISIRIFSISHFHLISLCKHTFKVNWVFRFHVITSEFFFNFFQKFFTWTYIGINGEVHHVHLLLNPLCISNYMCNGYLNSSDKFSYFDIFPEREPTNEVNRHCFCFR